MPLKTLPKPLVFLVAGALGSLLGWAGGELLAPLAPKPAPSRSGPSVTETAPWTFVRDLSLSGSAAPSMLFEPEVQRRLDAAGASGSGDIKIALSWGTYDDLDVHCIEPDGTRIFFLQKRSSSSGELDVDQNASNPLRLDPVEHIFWPVGRAPHGAYKIYVNRYFNNSNLPQVPFNLSLMIGGVAKNVEGVVSNTTITPPAIPTISFNYSVSRGEAAPVSGGETVIGVLMVAATLGLLSTGVGMAICSVQGRMLGGGGWIPRGWPKILGLGLGGGLLAGAIGQGALSQAADIDPRASLTLLKSVAWMVAGAVLGLGFSFFIPNLGRSKAIIAGVVGGLIAGLVVSSPLAGNPMLSRLMACLVMGGSTGLAIALVESMAREGFIRVHWAPGEVTTVNLGSRPVSVGTGAEATIKIPRSSGYPAIIADFRIELGKATMHHHMTGAKQPIRDGNKLPIGPVTLEFRIFS